MGGNERCTARDWSGLVSHFIQAVWRFAQAGGTKKNIDNSISIPYSDHPSIGTSPIATPTRKQYNTCTVSLSFTPRLAPSVSLDAHDAKSTACFLWVCANLDYVIPLQPDAEATLSPPN